MNSEKTNKTDLQDRLDIEQLVRSFYTRVLEDDTIGFIFTEVANFDLETHFPTMFDFWESIVFGKAIYQGNPMLKHIALNKKVKLTVDHFDRWVFLWKRTVDALFSGPNAELAIQRARSIKELMILKIRQSEVD